MYSALSQSDSTCSGSVSMMSSALSAAAACPPVRAASDKAANAGETLAERPHDQVNLVGQAEMRRCPMSVARDANAMRVIDHDARAILLADGDNFRHRRDVAAHTV